MQMRVADYDNYKNAGLCRDFNMRFNGGNFSLEEFPIPFVRLFLRHHMVDVQAIAVDKIEQRILRPDMELPTRLFRLHLLDVSRCVRVFIQSVDIFSNNPLILVGECFQVFCYFIRDLNVNHLLLSRRLL